MKHKKRKIKYLRKWNLRLWEKLRERNIEIETLITIAKMQRKELMEHGISPSRIVLTPVKGTSKWDFNAEDDR